MAGHPGDDDLESYAMHRCPPSRAEVIEEHLLLCKECCDRLESLDQFLSAFRAVAPTTLDSVEYRHQTPDGPVELRLTRAGPRWIARISAPNVEFERTTGSLREAFKYSRRAFRELFPEHVCCPECGPVSGNHQP
jgi:hypothetical protein